MRRKMVLRVKDSNPLGTQKTVSLDFDEEYARESRQGNFKISKLITYNYGCRRCTCLKYCLYGVKTLSNQSISHGLKTN